MCELCRLEAKLIRHALRAASIKRSRANSYPTRQRLAEAEEAERVARLAEGIVTPLPEPTINLCRRWQ